MKQFCILLAFCAVVGAAAGEFYRLDLNKLEPGTVLVQTDAAGKMRSLRPTWGMWPRTPDSVGAKVIERDGAKVLEIEKGFQVNSSEWNAGVSDAQQSVAYCRISFLLPELSGKGLDPKQCCVACGKCSQLMRLGSMAGCVVRDSVYTALYREAQQKATS